VIYLNGLGRPLSGNKENTMNGINAAKRCRSLSRRKENGRSVWLDANASSRRYCHHVNRRVVREQLALMRDFTEFLFDGGDLTPFSADDSFGKDFEQKSQKNDCLSAEEHRALCKKDRRSYYRRATHCGAVTVTAGKVFFQKAM
jgi:hypothetical protein